MTGDDAEIYYWDGKAVTQITNNDTYDNDPSLYGDMIAWYGWDGHDAEIYYAKIDKAAPVPEPSTVLLTSAGLVGLAALRKKFKKASLKTAVVSPHD